MVVRVTPATSVSFFRPEFDDFLYASIGEERNEMPLSVLSALARLGVDPWQEAAELSGLPKDPATQRLASLIALLPGGRWTQTDLWAIAGRLIELLPHGSSSDLPLAVKAYGLREMTGSTVVRLLISVALAAIALIVAASLEPSPRSGAGLQLPVPAEVDSAAPPLMTLT